MATSEDVTELLDGWSRGNPEALERLVPLVYTELRRIAAGQLRRERAGNTLQPTVLVHEAYLRLVNQRQVAWQNRAHFFGVSAQIMRRILVDHARRRHAGKRGRHAPHVSLDGATVEAPARDEINRRGDVVGSYQDAGGRRHGLVIPVRNGR